jgi:hypothetical protein
MSGGHHHGHGHGDHAEGGPGKAIGITMALLGVMLALCAAMVGSERTELVKTLVEQTNKWGVYQAETTKVRVVEGNLEMLRALTPSKAEASKLDETLRAKKASSGREDDEDTAELKDLIASSIDDMADLLAPDPEDIKHFEFLSKRYQQDVKEAKEDAEAYEGAVQAHESAAEWYERAQLAAEIGIVVASVALMLSSRPIWVISIVAMVGSLGTIGYTAWSTHGKMVVAEQKIEDAAKREAALEEEDSDDDEKPGGDAKPEGSAASEAPKDKEAPSASASGSSKAKDAPSGEKPKDLSKITPHE